MNFKSDWGTTPKTKTDQKAKNRKNCNLKPRSFPRCVKNYPQKLTVSSKKLWKNGRTFKQNTRKSAIFNPSRTNPQKVNLLSSNKRRHLTKWTGSSFTTETLLRVYARTNFQRRINNVSSKKWSHGCLMPKNARKNGLTILSQWTYRRRTLRSKDKTNWPWLRLTFKSKFSDCRG